MKEKYFLRKNGRWIEPRVRVGSEKESCVGISFKWWLDREWYWLPRAYSNLNISKHAQRYVFVWLAATIVLYWPMGGLLCSWDRRGVGVTIKAKFKRLCRRIDSLFLEFLLGRLSPIVMEECVSNFYITSDGLGSRVQHYHITASVAGIPVDCEILYSSAKRQTTVVLKPFSGVLE